MVGILRISTLQTKNDTTTATETATTTTLTDKMTSSSPRRDDNNEEDNDNNNMNDTENNTFESSQTMENPNNTNDSIKLNNLTTTTKEKVSGCTTDETCASTDMSASSEVNLESKDILPADDIDTKGNSLINTAIYEDDEEDMDNMDLSATKVHSTEATNSLKVMIPSDNIISNTKAPQDPSQYLSYKKYTKATTRSMKHHHSDQPSTPLGQVVESGQEHTGRWTRDEHESFLLALKKYGKEWKKVAAKVKTRTVVQTRTHAQKYFQKLQKQLSSKGGGVATTSTSMSAVDAAMMNLIHAKEEVGSDDEQQMDVVKKRRRRTSNQPPKIASALMENNTQSTSESLLDIKKGKIINNTARITRSTTASPYPERRTSTLKIADQPCPIAQAAAELMSKLATATMDLPSTDIVEPSQIPSSILEKEEPTIRIYPPSQFKNKKGMNFPEPSPAACGKRKLDELTAAQMLADVMSSNSKFDVVIPTTSEKKETPPQKEETPIKIEDETALSIINPDSLIQKRKLNSDTPSTPWDGQLEALLKTQMKSEDKEIVMTINETFYPIHNRNEQIPLHQAIYTASLTNVKSVLSNDSSSINQQDSLGFTPLHVASCLEDHTISSDIILLLLSYNTDTTLVDICGNTALHWASYTGNDKVIHLLSLRNCPLDKQNHDGETALHWAMRAGYKGMKAVNVLLDHGARPFLFNNLYKRPIDVAAFGFQFRKINLDQKCLILEHNELFNLEEIQKTRWNLLSSSPQSRTLVLHHPECLEHRPKTNRDWEVPDRVVQILKRISPSETQSDKGINFHDREITISQDFERASLELLSRVHSTEYLAFVNELSKELERKSSSCNDCGNSSPVAETCDSCSVVPFTPMVQKKIRKDIKIKQGNHSDTSFSVGSLRAARRAAGAVQHAVDCVLMGRNRNAFCIVRPPGHHAGYEGLLENGESCGFCIFNNVAAGAAHALSERHRPRCERCAIVDIDVHHGNGTEEIVQRFHDPSRLFFFSVHLYDKECPPASKKTTTCNYTCQNDNWKFYPGTGDTDDVALNIINAPIAPLWKEKDMQESLKNPKALKNTSSIHQNTRNRHKRKAAALKTPSSIDSPDVSSQISDSSATDNNNSDYDKSIPPPSPTPSTPTNPYLMGIGRKAYRRAIQHRLLPALRAFNPDLILISAGFDAAGGDVGNAKHLASGMKRERVGMDLDPTDYAWTTQKILEVADICCQGRVVSVLEGGYGHTPSTTSPDTDKDLVLDKTVFTECAAQHLWAFVDPYNVERRCG